MEKGRVLILNFSFIFTRFIRDSSEIFRKNFSQNDFASLLHTVSLLFFFGKGRMVGGLRWFIWQYLFFALSRAPFHSFGLLVERLRQRRIADFTLQHTRPITPLSPVLQPLSTLHTSVSVSSSSDQEAISSRLRALGYNRFRTQFESVRVFALINP